MSLVAVSDDVKQEEACGGGGDGKPAADSVSVPKEFLGAGAQVMNTHLSMDSFIVTGNNFLNNKCRIDDALVSCKTQT